MLSGWNLWASGLKATQDEGTENSGIQNKNKKWRAGIKDAARFLLGGGYVRATQQDVIFKPLRAEVEEQTLRSPLTSVSFCCSVIRHKLHEPVFFCFFFRNSQTSCSRFLEMTGSRRMSFCVVLASIIHRGHELTMRILCRRWKCLRASRWQEPGRCVQLCHASLWLINSFILAPFLIFININKPDWRWRLSSRTCGSLSSLTLTSARKQVPTEMVKFCNGLQVQSSCADHWFSVACWHLQIRKQLSLSEALKWI